MNHILFLNWLSLAIALSAFTYSNILTEPGQILHETYDRLERLLPEWIFKPLIGCQYCVAGQWALWFFMYVCFVEIRVPYYWFFHIWFIMQTIFITKIITYIYYQILDK